MFLMVFVFVCLVCALWTIYRIIGQSDRSIGQKLLISACFFISFFAPVIIKGCLGCNGFFYTLFYHIAYFAFVVVFLFFCLIVIRDGFWVIGLLFEKFQYGTPYRFTWKNSVLLAKINKILFFVAIVVTIWGLYEGLKTPIIKETIIQTNRIEEPITVAVLSDLHLHRTLQQEKIKQIVASVNKLKPDLIVFPGDTIDDDPYLIQGLLMDLQKLRAPLGIYATAGNHEFYIGHEKSKKALRNVGIHYLFNEGLLLKNNIYLAGVPDMWGVKRIKDSVDVSKAFENVTNKEYKILLSHTPSLIDNVYNQKVDLQISGHTHGGQIFPFHMVSWLLNKYLAGLYQIQGSYLYVSRGAGQWGPQVRILAPSEISVIKIVPENQDDLKILDNNVVDVKSIVGAATDDKTMDAVAELVVKNDKKTSEITNPIDMNKKNVKSIVEEVVDQSSSSNMNVLSESDASVEKELLIAQIEADKEAALDALAKKKIGQQKNDNQIMSEKNIINIEKENILSPNDIAFEEAKAQLDTEVDKILAQQKQTWGQKKYNDLAIKNEKSLFSKEQRKEDILNTELEEVKTEISSGFEKKKGTMKMATLVPSGVQSKNVSVKIFENTFQAKKNSALLPQKEITTFENKTKGINKTTKEAGLGVFENTEKQSMILPKANMSQEVKMVLNGVNHKKEMISEEQIGPTVVTRVTTHPDGRVTRTIIQTEVYETPTQIKTIKTVTSYTDMPLKEQSPSMDCCTLKQNIQNPIFLPIEPLLNSVSIIEIDNRNLPTELRCQQDCIKKDHLQNNYLPLFLNQNATFQIYQSDALDSISIIPLEIKKALTELRLPDFLLIGL